MRYLGGKSKTRKQIAQYLESVRKPGQSFLEPFCGGCWITQEMSGNRTASDSNKALITMYKALQNGWVPPDIVTEETYRLYKQTQDETDPCTAFIGIACSFGGRWFEGYARQNSSYSFAQGGKNSLLRQLPKIRDVRFSCRDYRDWNRVGNLIYCDPPYQGTTVYGGVDTFNSFLFWDIVRKWSKNNTVIVSEWCAPDDFVCVLEVPTKTILRDESNKPLQVVEKLFRYRG